MLPYHAGLCKARFSVIYQIIKLTNTEFNYIDTNNIFIITCYHIYIEIRRIFHKLLSTLANVSYFYFLKNKFNFYNSYKNLKIIIMHFTLIGHTVRRHVLFVDTSPLWVCSLENREFTRWDP